MVSFYVSLFGSCSRCWVESLLAFHYLEPPKRFHANKEHLNFNLRFLITATPYILPLRNLLPQILFCVFLLCSCGSGTSAKVEQEDSLYLFKPGAQYPYLLTAKDSAGKVFSTDTVTLMVEDSASLGTEGEVEQGYYSLSLTGYWKTDSIPDPVPAQLTADEHAYTLGFPAIYQKDFMTYTLPLEIDWVMSLGTQRNKLISGLTEGTLHPGPSYSIRRILTYVSNEDVRINKDKFTNCRKLIAIDESPIGKVMITYWVHPEFGFVQAHYQHIAGERAFTIHKGKA